MTSPVIINKKKTLLEDMKNILLFYRAIGYEHLLIKLQKRSSILTISSKGSNARSRAMKENDLKVLENIEIGDCKRCKLANKRTQIVFGDGNPNAELMFVGEAPGREEDIQGKPFVGDAGMLLTRLIEKMGFKRKDVYITNIVKCRPPMNRDPELDEIYTCKRFIDLQIEIIEPKVIMSLGRIAAQTLIDDTKIKITAIRGNFFKYKGIPLMPTFHPAYLIRNPKDKWLTWDDAQKVVNKLKRKD
jgi:DNA polymerase